METTLSGYVNNEFVRAWADEFERTFKAIKLARGFKLLLDLTGYEPADIETHKEMREVIPKFLLEHGMVPAFVKLFEDVDYHLVSDTKAKCIAFANVHHDISKMQSYQQKISSGNQQFFHSKKNAIDWITRVEEIRC